MRELDPQIAPPTPACAVVGAGRLGTALAAALGAAGPLKRGQPIPAGVEAVLLCVPDGEIARAAAAVPPGLLVGHCSGATGLEALGGREGFSLHPLMSVPAGSGPEVLRGAGAAVDGTTARGLELATTLARAAGMHPARVAPENRAAYHAAASIASNFLVTLEGAAERLAAAAGIERALLAPLVQAAAAQWAALGAEKALTGPIARGDGATVARQRAAVAERAPDLIPLWDALADATAALAAGRNARP
jgi:predicted short-subunit dehydrogenase-like oxidoreductase (DUF2520 family)